jgi:hypothetical protein
VMAHPGSDPTRRRGHVRTALHRARRQFPPAATAFALTGRKPRRRFDHTRGARFLGWWSSAHETRAPGLGGRDCSLADSAGGEALPASGPTASRRWPSWSPFHTPCRYDEQDGRPIAPVPSRPTSTSPLQPLLASIQPPAGVAVATNVGALTELVRRGRTANLWPAAAQGGAPKTVRQLTVADVDPILRCSLGQDLRRRSLEVAFTRARERCVHGPDQVVSPRADSCEDCGSRISLRVCTACGYVGCCESQLAHDRDHANETGHAVIRSLPVSA